MLKNYLQTQLALLGQFALCVQFFLVQVLHVACLAFLAGTCPTANNDVQANAIANTLNVIFFIF